MSQGCNLCHHLCNYFVVESNLQVEFCYLHNAFVILYLGFLKIQMFDEFKELVVDWRKKWRTSLYQGLWSNNIGWWDSIVFRGHYNLDEIWEDSSTNSRILTLENVWHLHCAMCKFQASTLCLSSWRVKCENRLR